MTQPGNPEPLSGGQLRASDADRQAVVDRLRRAHDEGRLTLVEYDERTRSAYAARTYADLDRLTFVLPDAACVVTAHEPVAEVATTGSGSEAHRRDVGNLVWRITASSWFGVSMINVLIWGAVSAASADLVYPWWIWVAGPWGIVILAGWLAGLGRSGRPDGAGRLGRPERGA